MFQSVAKYILFPFSLLYGCIVWIRNIMFDTGILKVHNLNFPVISVGNLAVGGTWGEEQGIDYGIFPQQLYVDYIRYYEYVE